MNPARYTEPVELHALTTLFKSITGSIKQITNQVQGARQTGYFDVMSEELMEKLKNVSDVLCT